MTRDPEAIRRLIREWSAEDDALEEARAYAASLLDRLWALGHELERVRMTVDTGGLDVGILQEATAAVRRANEGTLAEGSASTASIAREYGRLIDEARV